MTTLEESEKKIETASSDEYDQHLRVCAVSDEVVEANLTTSSAVASLGSVPFVSEDAIASSPQPPRKDKEEERHLARHAKQQGTQERKARDTNPTNTKGTKPPIQKRGGGGSAAVTTPAAPQLQPPKHSANISQMSSVVSVQDKSTFDDGLSGVFAPGGGGKWFW